MGGSWQTRKASADLSIFPIRRSSWAKARIETAKLVNSISQWRTFILVNPASCGVHALSFPFMFPVSLHSFISDCRLLGDSHFACRLELYRKNNRQHL